MSTAMIFKMHSTGFADTERLAEVLGRLLKVPAVIDLRSDLGGGKTTFVRGLARGAGSQETISSPSFTLSNIYKTKTGEIHHYDFYRLDDPGVLRGQLAESLNNPRVTTVVEWSNIVEEVLPDDKFTIIFTPVASDPEAREITVNYPESKAEIILKLENELKSIRS